MKQKWKAITGHEGLYQISNLGRVKRLQRIILTKNDKVYIHKEKILTGTIDGQRLYSCKINLSLEPEK